MLQPKFEAPGDVGRHKIQTRRHSGGSPAVGGSGSPAAVDSGRRERGRGRVDSGGAGGSRGRLGGGVHNVGGRTSVVVEGQHGGWRETEGGAEGTAQGDGGGGGGGYGAEAASRGRSGGEAHHEKSREARGAARFSGVDGGDEIERQENRCEEGGRAGEAVGVQRRQSHGRVKP
jgi:hypothetical protein